MAIAANRYWALLLLLIGAAACYTAGLVASFWLLVAVGVVLEGAFWRELIKRARRGVF